MYHPRIVHSCNVLEVSPSKWLISKVLLFLELVSQHLVSELLDSRISLLQTGHHHIFVIKFFYTKVQNLKFLDCEVKILRKIITKFQNLVRNILRDMICAS